MSEKTEETREIKTVVDDETVEQLVENRVPKKRTSRPEKKAGATPVRRKKKKKRTGLKIFIILLAYVLVFVISFLVSSWYFGQPDEPSTNNGTSDDSYTVDIDDVQESPYSNVEPDTVEPDDDEGTTTDNGDDDESDDSSTSSNEPSSTPSSPEPTTPKPAPEPTTPEPAPEPQPEDNGSSDNTGTDEGNGGFVDGI